MSVLKPKSGQWISASAVRFNRNGTVSVRTAKNPRNVAAGFYDATGFHPLRSSYDYDPDRAGDEYGDFGSGRKPKSKKKAKAKRKR